MDSFARLLRAEGGPAPSTANSGDGLPSGRFDLMKQVVIIS